jgi:hypothetical protein
MLEEQDAKQEENSSNSLEGAIASSPEAQKEAQEMVPETATPQKAEAQPAEEEQGETPLHEHPRFKEVIEEKNYWRQLVEQLVAQRQVPQPSPAQPQQDQYSGMTPEEKVFWQNVDARAEQKAKQIMQSQINPQLEAAKQEFARLRVEQFYKDHPDIKPGSSEEHQIAEKVKSGYLPDDAYRIVMWPKVVGQKRVNNQEEQKQKIEAKRKANVVSSGSSASAPPKKESFMEEIRREIMNSEITFD